MYEIEISREAERYYEHQDRKMKQRINRSIEVLRQDPLNGPRIKRLVGPLAGNYRYEVSGLRIVYEVDQGRRIVKIMAIGPRGDIYRRR